MGRRMQQRVVRNFFAFFATLAVLTAAKCGSKGYVTSPIPGVGQEVPLVQVDGKAVPTVIASGALSHTTVVAGKATLGEAIASGRDNGGFPSENGGHTNHTDGYRRCRFHRA